MLPGRFLFDVCPNSPYIKMYVYIEVETPCTINAMNINNVSNKSEINSVFVYYSAFANSSSLKTELILGPILVKRTYMCFHSSNAALQVFRF